MSDATTLSIGAAGDALMVGTSHRHIAFRAALALALLMCCVLRASGSETPRQHAPVTTQDPAGARLTEALRKGGLVLFFRHADTRGMPCDRSFRVGDREGQRNISPAGREQAKRIGETLRALRIPISHPVLAGPVYRARDTAELAFGMDNVQVTDGLLADDYSGGRLDWVLQEHRRLMSAPVAAGTNRVLVGHRTPAILVLGQSIGGRAFPEGSALVIEPQGTSARVLGILMLAPVPEGGFHGC